MASYPARSRRCRAQRLVAGCDTCPVARRRQSISYRAAPGPANAWRGGNSARKPRAIPRRFAPTGSESALDELGCRSEEHTSELQSVSNLVCRLLLEKKKKK